MEARQLSSARAHRSRLLLALVHADERDGSDAAAGAQSVMGLLRRTLHRLPRPVRRLLAWIPGASRVARSTTGRPGGPAPGSGTLRPVVYLPTWVQWSSMKQRPQYLLAAFARAGHPVFFVDTRATSPYDVDGVRVVPSLSHVPAANVILYVHFAPIRELFERFDDTVVVYDLLDDLSIYEADEQGMPEHRRVRAHHPALVRSAAAVIASSEVLAEGHRHERPDILLVENGVEIDRFGRPQGRPPEVPAGTPVVGYHGAIARWFDVELFTRVATANPQWRFVLVGPVAPEMREAIDRLGAAENVLVVGEQSSDRIPGYVQAFDVGAIWFRVDDLTKAVSPLKMYEYLAAGVPVVATPLPACVATPGVRVAATPEDMSRAIAEALEEPAELEQDRLATARAASWDRRLRPLLDRLDDLQLRVVP